MIGQAFVIRCVLVLTIDAGRHPAWGTHPGLVDQGFLAGFGIDKPASVSSVACYLCDLWYGQGVSI